MKEIFIGVITIIVLMTVCIVGKGVSVYNTHINLKTQIILGKRFLKLLKYQINIKMV